MIRPVEATIGDPRLARFLLSNPQKNESLMCMWLICNGVKCLWMLVDGAFEGTKD